MNTSAYRKFYLFSLLGVLLASAYPLYMGGRVLVDYLTKNIILAENYPKYIIPYTPLSIALILGVALMPLAIRFCKKYALPALSTFSIVVFFMMEFLIENMVIYTQTDTVNLESWQMYMCITPISYEKERLEDILLGEYSPAFKLHFYLIAIVLILCILNCFVGFAHTVGEHDTKKRKPLITQAVLCAVFLGLCILACFTAFFRTGELQISALSAFLMTIFFLVFGITAGTYIGALFYGKRQRLSVFLPSVTAALITAAMYGGEMILLGGRLYRFGTGWFFSSIGSLVLSPADILTILMSGVLTALLLRAISPKSVHIKA